MICRSAKNLAVCLFLCSPIGLRLLSANERRLDKHLLLNHWQQGCLKEIEKVRVRFSREDPLFRAGRTRVCDEPLIPIGQFEPCIFLQLESSEKVFRLRVGGGEDYTDHWKDYRPEPLPKLDPSGRVTGSIFYPARQLYKLKRYPGMEASIEGDGLDPAILDRAWKGFRVVLDRCADRLSTASHP